MTWGGGKRKRGSQRIVLARKINKILQWNEDLDRGLMAPQPCSGCLGHPVFSLLEISFAALLAFFLGLSAAGLIHLPVPWPNFRRLRVQALSPAATNSPTPEARVPRLSEARGSVEGLLKTEPTGKFL